jgi:hypothetical protein
MHMAYPVIIMKSSCIHIHSNASSFATCGSPTCKFPCGAAGICEYTPHHTGRGALVVNRSSSRASSTAASTAAMPQRCCSAAGACILAHAYCDGGGRNACRVACFRTRGRLAAGYIFAIFYCNIFNWTAVLKNSDRCSYICIV